MENIRLLLINAIHPHAEVQYRYPSLGLGYLASSLRSRFGSDIFQIRIVDRDIGKTLDEFCPHVVGITSVTQNYGIACTYAGLVKSRSIPVIMGGVHISALPNTLTSDMDLAVIGEGEETFADVMELFLQRRKFPLDELDKIRGIAFRERDGSLLQTVRRPLIEPLDRIPFPARDLLHIRPNSTIFSSRGCPYNCTFCFSTRYWNKVRFFSAEYVIEEMEKIVRDYGVRRISFYDDLMIADHSRFEKLVGMIRRSSLLSKIKYGISARANLVTDDVARLLSEMGVNMVGMGLESGNERTLRYLKGGSVSVKQNHSAIQSLHKYGIAVNAFLIIGSPDETKEEIMDTYRFIKDSGMDFVDTFVLIPLPGTPVWDYAKSIGAVSENMDWNRFNIYHHHKKNPIILSKHLTQKEIGRLYSKFRRRRLFLAARKAWFHPFFKEMCKAGIKMLFNQFRKIGGRLRFQSPSPSL